MAMRNFGSPFHALADYHLERGGMRLGQTVIGAQPLKIKAQVPAICAKECVCVMIV